MKQAYLQAKCWVAVFDNDLDAFVPEVWAQESLMVLDSNMVMAHLVHRDFENEIAQFGDVVNTRRPAKFKGIRKDDSDDVTIQDATAENVAVKLDQHWHISFLIRDGEESKSFQSLVDTYLVRGLWGMAQSIDETLAGEVYNFLGNAVGRLGTAPTRRTVIDARGVMNGNKAPADGLRSLVVTDGAETDLLDIDDFIQAEKVGDDGTAMREGSLGRKLGWNTFMSQNMPSVQAGVNTVTTGAVNNGTGYVVGDTVITVDGFAAAIVNGTWITIAGDATPQLVTASVGGGTPTELTISPGLRFDVVDDAVVTAYTPGAVNNGAGYDLLFCKAITIDGFTVAPQIGQLITFGTTLPRYSAIDSPDEPSITAVLLNRCLDAAVADDDVVGIGPAGDYNFGFHRNAVTLVSRPLAAPAEGTGARSHVAVFNNLAIRVTITYQGLKQGHLVTIDLLSGVKTLDTNLGIVMFT